MEFDKISKIIYHVLNTDLSCREYLDMNAAIQVKPYLIVKETSGVWYNYEYTNRLIQLEIYNSLGKLISEIYEGRWVLNSIEIVNDSRVQTIDLYAKIIDPGQNQVPWKRYGMGFTGLLKSISVLREMARFESIEHYLIFKENENLKSQIETLSSEIQILKTKVQSS